MTATNGIGEMWRHKRVLAASLIETAHVDDSRDGRVVRLLLDEHGLPWDQAWSITHQAVSYTNHTLMPEALETWSLPLFERMLPRHLEIVYEINARFLAEVRARYPGDEARVARMSLIDEGGERRVRMECDLDAGVAGGLYHNVDLFFGV